MTRSQFAAASPADPARRAPNRAAASSAPGTTPKATTSKPYLTRLASIGCPIVPVPMNPTFIAVLSSNHQIAAIDGHRTAGHPAGFVGGEKQDSADDILRLSQTAERDLRDRRAAPFRVGIAGPGQPGQSRAGGNRVDADAVRRQFERHRMGQRPAAAFRGDIGGALGAGDLGELRGDIDDAPAAALPHHLPGRRLPQMEHPGQIDRDNAVPSCRFEVEKGGGLADANAVEQKVEPAEFAHRRSNCGIDRRAVADIEAERRSPAANGADLRSGGLGRGCIDIGTDYPRPFSPETERARPADPAARAGNQRNLSRDPPHVSLPMCSTGSSTYVIIPDRSREEKPMTHIDVIHENAAWLENQSRQGSP